MWHAERFEPTRLAARPQSWTYIWPGALISTGFWFAGRAGSTRACTVVRAVVVVGLIGWLAGTPACLFTGLIGIVRLDNGSRVS